MDLSETKDDLKVFINPEIIDLQEGVVEMEEGCLSVPGIYASVERSEKVRIKALDINGEPFEVRCRRFAFHMHSA